MGCMGWRVVRIGTVSRRAEASEVWGRRDRTKDAVLDTAKLEVSVGNSKVRTNAYRKAFMALGTR